MFNKLPTLPEIPADGEFLLPICIDRAGLLKLIAQLDGYKKLSSDFDHEVTTRIFQAIEYIGREEFAPCLMDNNLPDEGDCNEYPAYAPFIEWTPQNPHTAPGQIPGGYISPPFVRFEDFISLPDFIPQFFEDIVEGLASELTNYQHGDVLSFLQSIPVVNSPVFPEMNNGYPTFKVSVSGTGVVELHLLAVPFGGVAVISVDVQPDIISILDGIISGNVQLIELNRDVLAVPPELDEDNIEEITLDSPGNHEIYVTFIPRINDEIPFIFFGGGLRKVVLCGDDLSPGVSTPVPIVNVIDDCRVDVSYDGGQTFETVMDFCEEKGMLRQNPTNPCLLESSTDGGDTWVQFADLSLCIGTDGMPGADGIDGREVEFNVSATHIQWRYVGESTWIDLIALDGLRGADGIDGADGADGFNGINGREVEFNVSATHIQWRYDGESTWIDLVALDSLKGADGADGIDGIDGIDGQDCDCNTNDLPEPPTQETDTNKLCSASTGLADRIIGIVTDIVNDLSTLTAIEVLEALLFGGGWNGSILQQLIAQLETANSATITSEFNAEKDNLIEELYCNELNKTSAVTWAQTVVSWSSVTQSVIAQAIESISDGQWALWTFIDGEKGLGDCSLYPCGTWEKIWDFSIDSGASDGWQPYSSGSTYVAGTGWRSTNYSSVQKLIRMEILPVTDINITYAEFEIYTENQQANYANGGNEAGIGLSGLLDGNGEFGALVDTRLLAINDSYVAYNDLLNPMTVDRVIVYGNSFIDNATHYYLRGVTLRGTGPNPFA